MVSDLTVRFTPDAVLDLKRMDKKTAQRVLDKIKWFSKNNELAVRLPLQNQLKGKYKLRAGDWRVIYELVDKDKVMVILYIGHRSVVYKR
jgi:mRNA interferase RelE/StbE